MLLEKFAPRSNARTGYEHLVARMDGALKDGLFAAKIGFHTEMLLQEPPTLLSKSKNLSDKTLFPSETNCLLPLLFRTSELPNTSCCLPVLSAKKEGVTIFVAVCVNEAEDTLNTDGDEVWYVHQGKGICDTVLGGMNYGPGDFIFIPRHFSCGFRTQEKTMLVGIESATALRKPAKKDGDNTDIPYNDFVVSFPDPNIRHRHKNTELLLAVKRGGRWHQVTYQNPPSCVAYKSTLYPFIINVSQLNFSYATSVHADPTNFCLFGTVDDSVMVSVLGSRFVHSIPYNHLNEWDEFLFYAKTYEARAGLVEAGDATLHPQGIWHGPQIPALMNWEKPEHPVWTDELAIMFESREPLLLCESAKGILVPDYEKSWLRGWEEFNKKE